MTFYTNSQEELNPTNVYNIKLKENHLPNNSALYRALKNTKIPVTRSTVNIQPEDMYKSNQSSLLKDNQFVKNELKVRNASSDVVGVKKQVQRMQSVPISDKHMSEKPPIASKSAVAEQRWKNKYEETEKKRKELLTESQKANRDKELLEKRVRKLENDLKQLSTDYEEQARVLNQLRTVSEKVYEDYDKLNNKYDTETKALHKALEVASKWYKQNKRLKRESVVLNKKVNALSVSAVEIDITDDVDGEDVGELDELKKQVTELSNQVGSLKSELNKARLQEFEAQEQTINLTQALEEERMMRLKLEEELEQLRIMRNKFESVTSIVKNEVDNLRSERDRATSDAKRLKAEASQAQKERNVLAHQSSLLMGEIASNETLLKLITEVEQLKRQLEEEETRHKGEIEELTVKLEERETEAQLELMEEKLKLAESELQLALQRAEQAERSNSELISKVERLESGPVEDVTSPCGPPPPPPPPPLPPPPAFANDSPSFAKKLAVRPGGSKLNSAPSTDSLTDMANLLGIQRVPKVAPQGAGVIDDLINEIKGGKFVLKATEKQQMKKEDPPPAVQEMLSIIGTLKRRPRHSRPPPPADEQL